MTICWLIVSSLCRLYKAPYNISIVFLVWTFKAWSPAYTNPCYHYYLTNIYFTFHMCQGLGYILLHLLYHFIPKTILEARYYDENIKVQGG